MKRTRSTSPEPKVEVEDNQNKSQDQESSKAASEMSSACPHLSQAFTSLNPPRPSQQIHKEECTLCFEDQVSGCYI